MASPAANPIRLSAESKKAVIRLDRLSELNKKAIKNAMDDIGRDYQKTMVRDMRKKDKRGIRYRVRVPRRARARIHRASAKRQTPASLSGRMASGIDYRVNGSTSMEFGATNVDYAKFLEEGTVNMAPRPGLFNTINRRRKETFNYFANQLQKMLFKRFNP